MRNGRRAHNSRLTPLTPLSALALEGGGVRWRAAARTCHHRSHVAGLVRARLLRKILLIELLDRCQRHQRRRRREGGGWLSEGPRRHRIDADDSSSSPSTAPRRRRASVALRVRRLLLLTRWRVVAVRRPMASLPAVRAHDVAVAARVVRVIGERVHLGLDAVETRAQARDI